MGMDVPPMTLEMVQYVATTDIWNQLSGNVKNGLHVDISFKRTT